MRTHYTLTLITAALCSASLLPSCSDDDAADFVNEVTDGQLDEESLPADPTGHVFTITTDEGYTTTLTFSSPNTAYLTTSSVSLDVSAVYTADGDAVAGRTDKANVIITIPAGYMMLADGSVNQSDVVITLELSNYHNSSLVLGVEMYDVDSEYNSEYIMNWAYDNFQTEGTNGSLSVTW